MQSGSYLGKELALALLDLLVQRPARGELHHDVHDTVLDKVLLECNDIRVPQVGHELHFLSNLASLLGRQLRHGNVKALHDHKHAVLFTLDETHGRECAPAERPQIFVGIHVDVSMGSQRGPTW